MDLNQYLEFCKSVAVFPKILVLKNPERLTEEKEQILKEYGFEFEDITWAYAYIGLVGEIGELGNHLKKVLRDDHFIITKERRAKILDEKGDVSWYDIILDWLLGINPLTKIWFNVRKLTRRKETGTLHDKNRHEN